MALLDLFSGIGGPIYEDIKELTLERLQTDGVPVPQVICGGFPCQDISVAGRGPGIIGERSGLWSEMFRLIRDVRPTWAIVENVSALRSKGLALVLQDFCSVGYCAEWHCIPANAVGAPHQRDRVWITARRYADSNCQSTSAQHDEASGVPEYLAHAHKQRLEGRLRKILQECSSERAARARGPRERRLSNIWDSEPRVGRVANGIPRRVDRLRQLGNAVVPQIPELIGRTILEVEETQ